MTLEYQVPQLGKVSANLYNFSTKTYKLLDHYGHIDRLRIIDQLGVIRNVYEGAHHSRWEYVMLQLSLIYKLSVERDEKDTKLAAGLGLSSNNIPFLGKYPTGAEILQIWTLLFNSGHLPGTFATERALLRCCKKDSEFRLALLNGLPHEENIKDYFKKLLEEEDIYSFQKILVLFHLQRYRRHKYNKSEFIEFLYDIIRFYIFPSEEHPENQKNLKFLFKRIRQISYLFLDFQYGPIPIDFDLGSIFVNIQDYIPMLFREHDSPMVSALDSLEKLLSTNMYHSADSIRELGIHVKRTKQILDKHKKEYKLCKISGLQRFLQKKYTIFEPEHTEWKNAQNIHILIDLPYPFLELLKKHLTWDIQEEYNRKYGTTYCLFTCQSAPTQEQIAITLSFYPHSEMKQNVCIIAKFIKSLFVINRKVKAEKMIKDYNFYDFIDDAFQKPLQRLLIYIFNYITRKNLSFEFRIDNVIIPVILSIVGSGKAANKIRRWSIHVDPSSSRIHELETLQKAMLNLDHRTELLVSMPRILVYDEQRNHLTDLDGFALGVKKGKLGVLLVEGKEQKKKSGIHSVTHLQNTIEKLNFITSKKPKIIKLEKGAYCYLTIDGLPRR
jgi:hypothetical protein